MNLNYLIMAALGGVFSSVGGVITPNTASDYTKSELKQMIPKGHPSRSKLIKAGSKG